MKKSSEDKCCLAGDVLITTSTGIKRIDEIEVGDFVLTHKKRYKKVTKVLSDFNEDIFELRVDGLPELLITGTHPVLSTELKIQINRETNNKEYVMTDAVWTDAGRLKENILIAVPYDDRIMNDYGITKEEAWLLGKYMIAGYHKEIKRDDAFPMTEVTIEKSNDKFEVYKEKLTKYILSEGSGIKNGSIYIKGGKINLLFQNMAKKSHQKEIPQYVMMLPTHLLKEFINGVLSELSDKEKIYNFYEFTVTSKKLAFQLSQIINKVYNNGCKIKEKRRNIDEEADKKLPAYKKRYFVLSFNSEKKMGIIRKNIEWKKVDSVKKIEKGMKMYNLVVEEDNSFIANNILMGDYEV